MIWSINQLVVKPSEGDMTNVVITVHWRCFSQQNLHGNPIYGECNSYCNISPPDPSSFIPYTSLKLEDVLGWIWASGVDKDAIELNVQNQIDLQINPPTLILPIPWETSLHA